MLWFQERKTALPPSVANASLEELQKLFVDSLKKLKARDKRIAELTAASEKSAAELAVLQGNSSHLAESSSGPPDSATALRLKVHDSSLDISDYSKVYGLFVDATHRDVRPASSHPM